MADHLGAGFDEVAAKELEAIEQRRQKVGFPDREIKKSLVGLALSGGGQRSASFCMGVVQALNAKGLWRYIDYLSTVSGGGYLGAFLSSSALKQGRPFTRETFPLAELPHHRQPPSVLRFIYGGRFLLSTWELANKYLIGLVLVNLAIFSALVAASALLAMLWRAFDTVWFRQRADMLDLGQDLLAAFWPAGLFSAMWLVAWGLSYYRRGASAPGRMARHLLHATAFALVVGIAMLLGNGNIGIPGFEDGVTVSRTWWGSIVGLIAGALLPLLRPQRLIQSGLKPKSVWERYVFIIVTTAMLAGVPLALIGSLGQENISSYSYAANRSLLQQDVDDPKVLYGLFVPDARALPKAVAKSSGDAGSAVAQSVPAALQLAIEQLSVAEQEQFVQTAQRVRATQDELVKAEAEFKHTAEFCDNWIEHYCIRVYQTIGFMLGDDNKAARFWRARKNAEQATGQLCGLINEKLLPSEVLLPHLQALPLPGDTHQSDTATADGKTTADAQKAKSYRNKVRDNLLVTSSLIPETMPRHERMKANRMLLEEHYPRAFRKRSEVRRVVVIAHDQARRLLIFEVSAFLFLCFGAWIDLNATSMHGYYRDRLARAFIVGRREKDSAIPLSELKTAEYGSPYHLLTASAGWFRRQLGQSQSSEQPASTSDDAPAGWIDSFLFSRHYCGCDATTYRKTESFEARLRGDLNHIDLAEAVALSGGAVSPGNVRNSFIAFLMFALNLRLGQWVPNPGGPRPRCRPNVLYLLWSVLRYPPEKRAYCFVSDGGYSENLGLVQLLRRKCRLIVAVDAGQDPEHCFDDLARAIREARIHYGVEIADVQAASGNADGAFQLRGLQLREPAERSGGETIDRSLVCHEHFILARLRYADGSEGLLAYVKPSMDGDEPVDLLQYRARHKEFPHESTSDQLFDADQVESYRQLGYHIGMRLLDRVTTVAEGTRPEPDYVEQLCRELQKKPVAASDRATPPESSGAAAESGAGATAASSSGGNNGAHPVIGTTQAPIIVLTSPPNAVATTMAPQALATKSKATLSKGKPLVTKKSRHPKKPK